MSCDLGAIVRVDDEALRTNFPTKLSLGRQLFNIAVIQFRIITVEVSNWRVEAAIEGALHSIDDKSG